MQRNNNTKQKNKDMESAGRSKIQRKKMMQLFLQAFPGHDETS